MGIIVERRPPIWRRLPRGYVALYRRLKDWAGCEEKAEAQDLYEQQGLAPRRMSLDLALVIIAFSAIIVLWTAANLLSAWLWIPCVLVTAVAAPIASFLFRLPGPGGI